MAQCTLEAYLGSTPNTKNKEKKRKKKSPIQSEEQGAWSSNLLYHGDLASSYFLEAKQGTPLHDHLSISIQKIDLVF